MYMKEKNTRSWRILQIEKQGQKTIDAIKGESNPGEAKRKPMTPQAPTPTPKNK